jgi:hypothetical protein
VSGETIVSDGNLTISGNLTVSGTTTTVESTTIQITNSFTFEGSTADANETTLGVVDPTADRTINLPNQSGTIPVLEAVSATQITATPEELNIMDGGTSATSTTVADADRVVLNDNGTMVQVAVTDLAAYFDDEITAMPNLVTTAATTVGALNSGSITTDFGNIDNGTSNITTGGLLSIDIDSGATINTSGGGIGAAGSITLGAGADAGLYVSSDNLYIENKTQDKDIIFRVNDGGTFTTIAHVDGADGRFQFAAGKLDIAGTAVTATAAELNYLDNDALTAADLTKLAALDVTAAELNLLDGGTSVGSSITLADNDGIIVNDGGTMKSIPASDLATYVGSGAGATTNNALNSPASGNLATDSSGLTAGDVVAINGSGEIIGASAATGGDPEVVGVATANVSSSADIGSSVHSAWGKIVNVTTASESITAGSTIYLSRTVGLATGTLPNTAGDTIYRLGYAAEATSSANDIDIIWMPQFIAEL